jgi:two-component sensor histidine kinase/uncharacterized protein (UPF0333 family)
MQSWKNANAIPLAVGLVAVFVALFVGLFGYFIVQGVRQNQERLEEQSFSAAQVVATNAYWIAELANQTLERVDVALGPDLAEADEAIRAVLESIPTQAEVYVIDQNARTVYATLDGASSVSVADREYFTALRDGARFYISPLLTSRINNERIFVFSKRLEREDAFAGAIMLSFPESLLGELWATLGLQQGSTISLVRDDGQIMARHPPTDGPLDLSGHRLIQEFYPASDTGTYASPASPVDGIARVVSYRKIPGKPILALASVASDERWRDFNKAIWTVILIASPILLALVLGCWWIVWLLLRDRKRSAELQASVDLNTMLFREIHHRVKNNLQSMQALVRMQDMPDKVKRDLQSRLAAMGAMHEHIYEHDSYGDIDAHDFVPAVVEQIRAAYGSTAEVEYHVHHVVIDRDHATPLALLLSEVITNAFKYAFPDGRPGKIEVLIRNGDDGRAQVIVSDNGVGMDPATSSRSMGMRLVQGTVAQMGGTYEFRNEGGVVFDARLPLSISARRKTKDDAAAH